MVTMAPPSVNSRAGFEALFQHAFTTARRTQFSDTGTLDNCPNEACGDPMNAAFEGLYIWSNNVNTLSLHNDLADLHELCRQLKHYNVGIAALQEINIDLTQTYIYRRVKEVFDEHFDSQCLLVCSSTAIRSATNWKPGSTLLVVLPTWAPYVTTRAKDDLGRWCSVTLQVRDYRQIVIYSYYNCCKTRIEQAGIHTIFAQQWHVLRQRGDISPDPRLQAVIDLGAELAVHQSNQRSVCIVGDCNEDIGHEPALLASLCGKYDLVDVMDLLHPNQASIPSYARSANRLDYVLLTQDLLPYVDHAGLNHYHEFYPSDHRPIFVGLESRLFGPLPAMAPHRSRYVHSNSKMIGPFIVKVYQHLLETGTFVRIKTLMADIDTKLPAEISHVANSIDDQITKALLSAERKCKKPPREPWSEAVHFASLHVKYWRVKCAATANSYDATPTLATINPLLPLTQQIADNGCRTDQQELNSAKRNLVRTRRNATQLRKAFLQELRERIAMRKTSSTLSPAASLKCIDKQLRQTAHYGHIKATLKPTIPSSLTKVHITTTTQLADPVTGEITEVQNVTVVDTKAELESRILARNKKHFAQAEGSPFTTTPLKDLTPAHSLETFFDSSGQPINLPNGTFQETATVLEILRDAFRARPPAIASTVLFEDFVTSFLHWDEKTSTSPSGRHLGLYKSIVTAHIDSGAEFTEAQDDALSTSSKATLILHAIHDIAVCVAERGLYLHRWIHVTNAMIYKKPGVLELDELRVIHLFEADFNLLVGLIFGRRTVHNAVDHQKLHPCQFGKKGGECMDAAISKTLHNVISTYTKTSLGQFESDATACFDRIVMSFAMLCFFAYGCPLLLINFWLGVLRHHSHKVKTSHGISAGSYAYSADSPIHGPGQGSRGGPGSCVLTTSVLLHAQDKLSHGATFCDPSQTTQYRNRAAMFIDDNTSASNQFVRWLHTPPEAADVVNLLQTDAQVWERLLFTSGGLLKLRKCLYYVMQWDFDSEGRASLRPSSNIPALKLTNGHDVNPQPVNQYDCSQAHRYLGLWNSPSLSMTANKKALAETAKNYSHRLFKSGLSTHEVWLAYFACFVPAMVFTFPVCSFTKIELTTLQKNPVRATLARLGLNRNISRDIVFGSALYGGVGLLDLFVEQGIAQLQLLLRHLRAETTQGSLMLIGLSWWHLVAGFSSSLWDNPQSNISYVEHSWYNSIKDFLLHANGSVYISPSAFITWQPLRDHDATLMEQISSLDGVSRADMKSFNRCRLFAGVMYLSEISTADGTSIARDSWTGTRQRFSPLLWPFQPSPGPNSWRVWRRLLARAFLEDAPKRATPKTKDLHLLHPLGAWLPGSEWIFGKWSFFYSPSTGHIYHSTQQTYQVHHRRRRSRQRSHLFSATPATSTTSPPPDHIPVDELSSSATLLTFRGLRLRRRALPLTPMPLSFSAYLSLLPGWDQRLLQHVTILDAPALIEYFTTDGTLFVVSDGGADGECGSYGALLATDDAMLVQISGVTEGALPGSFRAESYGCLAIFRFIYHFRRYYQLDRILCRNAFYCDNEGLITRLNCAAGPLAPFPRHYLRSDIDLEMQIMDTIRLLGIDVRYHHVKGHQDDPDPTTNVPLSRQANLNIVCDHLATAALHVARPSPLVTFLPAGKVAVTIDGHSINRKLPRAIRTLLGRRLQLSSFHRRYGWSPAQFDQIDWPQYRSASSKLSLKKRHFVIKWLNDLLPFQARMQKYGQSVLAGCPEECGCASEDHHHLLHCPTEHRQALFSQLDTDLEQLYETHTIDPHLRRVVKILLAPYHGAVFEFELPTEYANLVNFQTTLHPDSIFMGCLSAEWIRSQHRYLKLNHYSRNQGQACTGIRAMVALFLEFVHSMWLLRNKALHGDDTTTILLSYKHTQLLLEIQDLYDQVDSMLVADRGLFIHPYDYWLDKPSTELTTFLKQMRPTVKVSVEQAADMGPNFRSIASYFPVPIPPELFDVILGKPHIPPEPD
jgi:hypothetical protein